MADREPPALQSAIPKPDDPLITLVYEAVRFANWAAGEGFTPAAGEDARDPAEFLMEWWDATGRTAEFEDTPNHIRERMKELINGR